MAVSGGLAVDALGGSFALAAAAAAPFQLDPKDRLGLPFRLDLFREHGNEMIGIWD